MHDIKHLEDLWEQYHKNRRKPYYYTYGFLILALSAGSYYALTHNLNNFKNLFSSPADKKEISAGTSTHKVYTNNFLLNDTLSKIQEKNITIKSIVPDLNIKKEVIGVENEVAIPTLPVVDEIPMIENSQNTTLKKVYKQELLPKVSSVIQKPRKRMHLNIIQSSNNNAYLEVEKRFKQFRDPDDSLFLAKVYYDKGNYTKSETWALKTNKINNNIEESWIIFAKSKVKLGKIDEAIHILKSYMTQSNSQAAKLLLLKLTK